MSQLITIIVDFHFKKEEFQMKKSYFVLAMLLLILLSIIPSHAFAQSKEGHSQNVDHKHFEDIGATILDNEEGESDKSLLYVPCPKGGKHTMVGRGLGYVYVDGKMVIDRGQTSQCSKCHTVIISEYNPFYSWATKLGTYANQGTSAPTGNPTVMYSDRTYYNSSLASMTSYTW